MIGAIPIVAENRIREALERDEFENLESVSRPFRDLDGYDGPDWWITRKLRREQSSAEDMALPVKESRS
jgi:Domain of unknown function (DUF1992)